MTNAVTCAPLHMFSDPQTAQHILDSVSSSNVLHASKRSHSVKFTLDSLAGNETKALILYKDDKKDTPPHKRIKFLMPFEKFISSNNFVKWIDLTQGDEYGNTLCSYLTLNQNRKFLFEILQPLTLQERRLLLSSRNFIGLSSLDLAYLTSAELLSNSWKFFGFKMAKEDNRSLSLSRKTKLLKASHCMCNDYVNTGTTIFYVDKNSSVKDVLSSLDDSVNALQGDFPCLVLLIDFVSPDPTATAYLQSCIDQLNNSNLNGRPKVLYFQRRVETVSDGFCVDEEFSQLLGSVIIPPDCAVLSALTSWDLRKSLVNFWENLQPQMAQQQLWKLRKWLLTHPNTNSYISSSLGRRLYMKISKAAQLPEFKAELLQKHCYFLPGPHHELSGSFKCDGYIVDEWNTMYKTYTDQSSSGSCLVLCTTKGRSGSSDEMRDVKSILQDLNIQVEEKTDLSADHMLEAVRKFAEKNEARDFLTCIVLSHGNLKDDIVDKGNNPIRVQAILDALNTKISQPKIVMFQYCRGNFLGIKLPDNDERNHLKYQVRPGFGGSNQLWQKDEADLSNLSSYSVPDNFFVVFSTLKDCRSRRKFMFKEFAEHLKELKNSIFPWAYPQMLNQEIFGGYPILNQDTIGIDIVDLMTDVAGRVRDASLLTRHLVTENSLRNHFYLRLSRTP